MCGHLGFTSVAGKSRAWLIARKLPIFLTSTFVFENAQQGKTGGGVPLARGSLILSKLKADNDDQRFGIEIVARRCRLRCGRLPRMPARVVR